MSARKLSVWPTTGATRTSGRVTEIQAPPVNINKVLRGALAFLTALALVLWTLIHSCQL